LSEALELTALIALHDRQRGARYTVRWLQRWLEESKAPTVEDALMVGACLNALGGTRHEDPLSSLSCDGLTPEKPTSPKGARVLLARSSCYRPFTSGTRTSPNGRETEPMLWRLKSYAPRCATRT
jgi:hypothetical protein